MSRLGERERRALLILLVSLPVFAVAYGARPLVGAMRERSAALVQQQELLDRERALVGEAPALTTPLTDLRAALARESRSLVRGESRATAHSALIDHLRTVARRQEVLVTQAGELAVDASDTRFALLRVNLRAESDLAGIARFLRALEADQFRLRVSGVLIERSGQGAFGGGPAATDGRNVLVLNATIEALALIGSSGDRGAQ